MYMPEPLWLQVKMSSLQRLPLWRPNSFSQSRETFYTFSRTDRIKGTLVTAVVYTYILSTKLLIGRNVFWDLGECLAIIILLSSLLSCYKQRGMIDSCRSRRHALAVRHCISLSLDTKYWHIVSLVNVRRFRFKYNTTWRSSLVCSNFWVLLKQVPLIINE